MADGIPIPRAKRPKLHHLKPTNDVDRPHLFHDSSYRCSKCVNIVSTVERAKNHEPHDEHVPGYMAPRKFRRSQRVYEANLICFTCRHNIRLGEYHKLGDNLIEAHRSTEDVPAVPAEGCCYLCLLLLQVKCRNGILHSKRIPSSESYRPIFGLFSEGFLLFSDSIDVTVSVKSYLPQRQKEGTEIRILPRQKIDLQSVKSWLKSCEVGHKDHCGQLLLGSKTAKISQRIFIDVKDQKLILCQYDCRYVALSYVWGGVSQLLLTKSNEESLFRNGAFKTFEKDIPQVVKDAMQAVDSIGERLLWVDSLCIVQDDEFAKHHLILEMASIYDRALVTIIAASGKSAGDGLPGVSENNRVLEDLVEVPGTDIHFMERLPLKHTMDYSRYNKRGWTFQERLLSRRCLYFTDTQIFFECQRHSYSEDRSGMRVEDHPYDEGSPRSGNLINKNLIEFGDSLASEEDRQMLRYSSIVEEYCHKQFTFIDDILDAFAGIEAAMEHLCGWTMIYGLPEQLLDRAILWEPEARTSLFDKSHKLEARNSKFPTWSWSAWIGDVYYNEWTASKLRVFHSPFKMVYSSVNNNLPRSTLNNHLKPSVLSFSSECLPGSTFSIQNTTFRNEQTCSILNTRGEYIGTIPGVESSFAQDYESGLVDMVLLSASKLAVNRFASRADMGYPDFFCTKYPKNDWSVLTIMLVKWSAGYAKRIALAYIHRDAWKEAGPKIKPVLLA